MRRVSPGVLVLLPLIACAGGAPRESGTPRPSGPSLPVASSSASPSTSTSASASTSERGADEPPLPRPPFPAPVPLALVGLDAAHYPARFPRLADADRPAREEAVRKALAPANVIHAHVDELGLPVDVALDAPPGVPTHRVSPALFNDAEVVAWSRWIAEHAAIFGVAEPSTFQLARVGDGSEILVGQDFVGAKIIVSRDPEAPSRFRITGHLIPGAGPPIVRLRVEQAAKAMVGKPFWEEERRAPGCDPTPGRNDCRDRAPPTVIMHSVQPRDVRLEAVALAVRTDKAVEIRFGYRMTLVGKPDASGESPRAVRHLPPVVVDQSSGATIADGTYRVLGQREVFAPGYAAPRE
jgi:hypothetical protein